MRTKINTIKRKIKNGADILLHPTNGEMLMSMFDCKILYISEPSIVVKLNESTTKFNLDWWETLYKESDTD